MGENSRIYDILIIGGGAAGLAAAVTAAGFAKKARIGLIEKNDRVGKKLIATGNGRCNLSNGGELTGRYHGDADFAQAVLSIVSVKETLDFLKEIDIPSVTLEDKKIFPCSLQAGAVVDALRYAAAEKGVEIYSGCTVSAVTFEKGQKIFKSAGQYGALYSKKVLVCTGGKAAPKTGSDGGGYQFLTMMGHKLAEPFPSVVQITTETGPIKALKGIKMDCSVTVVSKDEKKTEKGELLFTEYGISGPPAMHLSRLVSKNKGGQITVDMLPYFSEAQLYNELVRRKCAHPQRDTALLLTGLLHSRLGQTVVKQSLSGDSGRNFSQLSENELLKTVRNIKAFSLCATGTLSWHSAQVTAGGIETAGFDTHTMESKIVKGLYAAGEVLNVDGDCGGFNLQWAWSSGILAGKSMARDMI